MTPREAVLSACAEILGERPTDEAKTLDNLGADSLDRMEITVAIEDVLNVNLDPWASEIGPETSIASLISLVERVAAKVGA